MQPFLVKFRVGNKTQEERIFASSEKEAEKQMKNHLGWEHPKKSSKIISVKSLSPLKKRLKSNRETDKDTFGY
jgi:hypothetical protein